MFTIGSVLKTSLLVWVHKMISKSTKGNTSGRSHITALTIFNVLLKFGNTYNSTIKVLYIIVSWITSIDGTNGVLVCYDFFHNFCFLYFWCFFLSLYYVFFLDNSNSLLSLLLLSYCFFLFKWYQPKGIFCQVFQNRNRTNEYLFYNTFIHRGRNI